MKCRTRYFLWIFPYTSHNWSSWIGYDILRKETIPDLFEEGKNVVREWTTSWERRKCLDCGKVQDKEIIINWPDFN